MNVESRPIRSYGVLGCYALGLLVYFARDVSAWVCFAFDSSLYSYTLLIPWISLYLLLARRPPAAPVRLSRIQTSILLCAGTFLLLAGLLRAGSGPSLLQRDRLAGLVVLMILGTGVVQGWRGLCGNLFPWLFLFLVIPLTTAQESALAAFLQHASGRAACALFQLAGTPVFREGDLLLVPGLKLVVAEECSGIRSTLVLLITSLLGGYILLQRPLHRLILVALVIPLGILRNAFRIVTIALLTLHVDPGVIHGPVHTQGGPVFFALSLIPLLLVLVLLRRREHRGGGRKSRRHP